MTLAEFSKVSFKMNQHTDHGIYYPFTHVTEKNMNSGFQYSNDYDDNSYNEENDENHNNFAHIEISSKSSPLKEDSEDSSNSPSQPKKKEVSLNIESNINRNQKPKNAKQSFPVIKKQRKKPRRSDISLNMAFFNPKNSSMDNLSEVDVDPSISFDKVQSNPVENKFKAKNDFLIEKQLKHPSSIPLSKKQTELNTKMNANMKKHQSIKLCRFAKKSKSHLNLLDKNGQT